MGTGDFRAGHHGHGGTGPAPHRHLREGERPHGHRRVRTPGQALGIGLLHGLAGTGAVALLLIAALPSKVEAAAALAVFAPMSAVSMTLCTTAFAWLLTRRLIDPIYRNVLIPAFGLFGSCSAPGTSGSVSDAATIRGFPAANPG